MIIMLKYISQPGFLFRINLIDRLPRITAYQVPVDNLANIDVKFAVFAELIAFLV